VVDFVAMVFGMPLALFPRSPTGWGPARARPPLHRARGGGADRDGDGRWTARVHRHGLGVMVAATVWGIGIVAFGLSESLWPALLGLALAGGADCVSGIFRGTMWNQTIPDALRGRLAAIEMVSYMSGPLLGHAEAGAVAALFGVSASVISGGVLCVVACSSAERCCRASCATTRASCSSSPQARRQRTRPRAATFQVPSTFPRRP